MLRGIRSNLSHHGGRRKEGRGKRKGKGKGGRGKGRGNGEEQLVL